MLDFGILHVVVFFLKLSNVIKMFFSILKAIDVLMLKGGKLPGTQ